LTDSVPFPETIPAPDDLPAPAPPPGQDTAQPDMAAAEPIAVAQPTREEAVPAPAPQPEPAPGGPEPPPLDAYGEAEAPVSAGGFDSLGLSEPILRAVAEKGYLTPTPIQLQAIPAVLAGRDVLGVAQTGTGKTAGFTLPMLDILSGSRARARMPRSLILEPTRELALQVAENFVLYGKYLKLTHALIIGGESMSDQKDLLMRGVDVLIATPGRLIDMFERGGVLLSDCRVLVIDETDRMLDMGFIPDVERIVALLPTSRQTLFFSATMAPEIRRLADAFLQNPKLITVSKSATVATTIVQKLTLVAEQDKREALRRLIRSEDVQNALIFCNRKRDVDILYKSLTRHNFSVAALHGDMAQPVRFATLEKFKAGDVRLLCCSDVAARGLDIGGLSHVFNFDVPIHAEDYVHRIGRTGRAGREGRAFMLATPDDRLAVEAIQKLTGGNAIERMQIEGLDPVDWAEGDGRRRRGRAGKPAGRAKPEPRRAEPKHAEAKPAAPKKAAAAPRRAPSKPPEARVAEAAPAAAPPRPRAEGRTRVPRPEPAARPEPVRQDRGDRPERVYRRDDDLGPGVVGFGDDVPAFMMVPARRRPAAHRAAEDAEVEA
jgi:superfamily II DNA/RNA helicase